jgi:hypothetical protein
MNAVNDPPVANDQSVTTAENIPVDITLTASDHGVMPYQRCIVEHLISDE